MGNCHQRALFDETDEFRKIKLTICISLLTLQIDQNNDKFRVSSFLVA